MLGPREARKKCSPRRIAISHLISPGAVVRTLPASIERSHVENVHALHLAENFQTLETGGLLKIGRDGTGLAALRHKVVLGGDLCKSGF